MPKQKKTNNKMPDNLFKIWSGVDKETQQWIIDEAFRLRITESQFIRIVLVSRRNSGNPVTIG